MKKDDMVFTIACVAIAAVWTAYSIYTGWTLLEHQRETYCAEYPSCCDGTAMCDTIGGVSTWFMLERAFIIMTFIGLYMMSYEPPKKRRRKND